MDQYEFNKFSLLEDHTFYKPRQLQGQECKRLFDCRRPQFCCKDLGICMEDREKCVLIKDV